MADYRPILETAYGVMREKSLPLLKLMYLRNERDEDFEIFYKDFLPIMQQIHNYFERIMGDDAPIRADKKAWEIFLREIIIMRRHKKDVPKGLPLACVVMFNAAKIAARSLPIEWWLRIRITTEKALEFQCGVNTPDLSEQKSRMLLYGFIGSDKMFKPFRTSITYNNKNLEKAAMRASKKFHNALVEFKK